MTTPKREHKSRKRKGTVLFPAGPAMRRAAKRAREVAKRFGTPVWYMKNGNLIAEYPAYRSGEGDIAILNANAAALNAEAEDVLEFQKLP